MNPNKTKKSRTNPSGYKSDLRINKRSRFLQKKARAIAKKGRSINGAPRRKG